MSEKINKKIQEEQLLEKLKQDYSVSKQAFSEWKQTLEEKERWLYGKPKENTAGKTNINDPRLFSQTFERSIRVMSQLATGKFKGVSSDDTGKNLLMNLIVDRWVIPNANAQFDFLTKLRMIDWYSLAYGSMVALVDWSVTPTYIGPELYLVPIRNVYPEPNTSFADMQYCQIVSEVDVSFLKERAGMKGWKNVKLLLEMVKDTGGFTPSDKDADELSYNDEAYNTQTTGNTNYPKVRLCTEYQRDRWITYALDYDLILRDIPNPHGNHQLPIVVKYCIPMIDFCFGLSEVEISSSLAGLVNSLYNLAIDDAKMQLFPPLMIDANSVYLSSIKMGAGRKWMLNGKNARAPEPFTTNSRGATSALEMRQMAIGSLQTLAGTSDTTVKQGSEASMGKTPQALKMQEARQSSRDEIDRFYMEQFIQAVYTRFANLIVKMMPQEITLRLFSTEVKNIAKAFPDVLTLVYGDIENDEKVTLKLPANFFEGCSFDYEVTPGSTYKIDQQTQAENLQFILELSQSSGIASALEAAGKKLDVAEAINRLLVNSGIADPDKILIDQVPEGGELQEALPPQQLMAEPTPMQAPTQQMPAEGML